jgi:hypothetical protein
MKSTLIKLSTVIVFVIGLIPSLQAQEFTHLQTHELNSFNQLRLDIDANVFLIKSTRNQVTLVGDSSYVADPNIRQQNGVLALGYMESDNYNLDRVVIEYKEVNRVIINGTGEYYFYRMDADDVQIFNNSAKLTLNGKVNRIGIYSQIGNVDVTGLKAKKLRSEMGETATLLVPKEIYTIQN